MICGSNLVYILLGGGGPLSTTGQMTLGIQQQCVNLLWYFISFSRTLLHGVDYKRKQTTVFGGT
jgi:hypothetical protein